ncbi:MAG: hypothetical protein AAFP03_19100 [Cyanobacteria bacterium J06598_3]
MLPFLLTGILGAYALMVRLLQVSSKETIPTPRYQPAITCQICKSPMRQLKGTELRQHLTPPQRTELELKSKFYEGWQCEQCEQCLPPYHPQDLNIHLSSYVLNKKGYEECPSCQTLTVKVTRYPLIKATTQKEGKRTERRCCHYCKARSTREVVIPTLSRRRSAHSSRPNSGGHYCGDSGGSCYSSEGGSFDGSSFGSGDSGGGGAGDSW